MNVTDFMQAMNNPQAYVTQQFANQLISEHPNEWQAAQNMINGKSHKQQVAELRKLYQSKGLNLDDLKLAGGK